MSRSEEPEVRKEPTVVIRFNRESGTTPEAHVAHGNYDYVFKRAEQPFVINESDWLDHVARFGLFELVENKPALPPLASAPPAPQPPARQGENQGVEAAK